MESKDTPDPVDTYVSACRKFKRTEEQLRVMEEAYEAAIEEKKAALSAVARGADCAFCLVRAGQLCKIGGKPSKASVHSPRVEAAIRNLRALGIKET